LDNAFCIAILAWLIYFSEDTDLGAISDWNTLVLPLQAEEMQMELSS
jgi:ABC-type cobalamin transport system permease subunit